MKGQNLYCNKSLRGIKKYRKGYDQIKWDKPDQSKKPDKLKKEKK